MILIRNCHLHMNDWGLELRMSPGNGAHTEGKVCGHLMLILILTLVLVWQTWTPTLHSAPYSAIANAAACHLQHRKACTNLQCCVRF